MFAFPDGTEKGVMLVLFGLLRFQLSNSALGTHLFLVPWESFFLESAGYAGGGPFTGETALARLGVAALSSFSLFLMETQNDMELLSPVPLPGPGAGEAANHCLTRFAGGVGTPTGKFFMGVLVAAAGPLVTAPGLAAGVAICPGCVPDSEMLMCLADLTSSSDSSGGLDNTLLGSES